MKLNVMYLAPYCTRRALKRKAISTSFEKVFDLLIKEAKPMIITSSVAILFRQIRRGYVMYKKLFPEMWNFTHLHIEDFI